MVAGAAWGPTGDESQGSPVLSQQQGVDLGARASESQGHSGTQVADDVVMTGTISRCVQGQSVHGGVFYRGLGHPWAGSRLYGCMLGTVLPESCSFEVICAWLMPLASLNSFPAVCIKPKPSSLQ